MSIKISLPRSLSTVVKSKLAVEVDGETVGECINKLIGMIPQISKKLFYVAAGEPALLRSHVTIFVNQKSVNETGMETAVNGGDEIEIRLTRH